MIFSYFETLVFEVAIATRLRTEIFALKKNKNAPESEERSGRLSSDPPDYSRRGIYPDQFHAFRGSKLREDQATVHRSFFFSFVS